MAFKQIILSALLVALAKGSASNYGYSGYLNGYSSNYDQLGYSAGLNEDYFGDYNNYNGYQSQNTYSTQSQVNGYSSYPSYSESRYEEPQTYSSHYSTNSYQQRSEPEVYEYSSQIGSLGSISKSTIVPQTPLYHNAYKSEAISPYSSYEQHGYNGLLNKGLSINSGYNYDGFVPKPIAPIHIEPSVKTIAEEPTVSEYSTYTASSPSYTKTEIKPQPDIVHENYVPGYVQKSVEPVPIVPRTVQSGLVHQNYAQYAPIVNQEQIVHKSLEPARIVEKSVEPLAPLKATIKTIAEEPTVSEYSTYTASAPSFTKTDVKPQPDIVHEKIIPGYVQKSLEPLPVVRKTIESVPIVHKTVEPTIVQENYVPSAPIVQKIVEPVNIPSQAQIKTISHEPTVSEFSSYTASAPSFTKTDIKPQPDLVHESVVPGFVHKSYEPAASRVTGGYPAMRHSYAPAYGNQNW